MAAGPLFGCAAGMKNRRAFGRREAGQFKFLKRCCRHGGNLCPMLDELRRPLAHFADFPVGGIVSELKRKKFQCEFGELPITGCRLPVGNQLAQTRGEIEKFFIHAVLIHGWCSATAGGHYNTKHLRCKRDCLCVICASNCGFDNEQTVLHHHRN